MSGYSKSAMAVTMGPSVDDDDVADDDEVVELAESVLEVVRVGLSLSLPLPPSPLSGTPGSGTPPGGTTPGGGTPAMAIIG